MRMVDSSTGDGDVCTDALAEQSGRCVCEDCAIGPRHGARSQVGTHMVRGLQPVEYQHTIQFSSERHMRHAIKRQVDTDAVTPTRQVGDSRGVNCQGPAMTHDNISSRTCTGQPSFNFIQHITHEIF